MSKKPIGYILVHDSIIIKGELESLKEKNLELYYKLKETFNHDNMTLEAFDVFLLKGRKYKPIRKKVEYNLYTLNCSFANEFHKKIGKKYRYIGSEDFNHLIGYNESLRVFLIELGKLGFKRIDYQK